MEVEDGTCELFEINVPANLLVSLQLFTLAMDERSYLWEEVVMFSAQRLGGISYSLKPALMTQDPPEDILSAWKSLTKGSNPRPPWRRSSRMHGHLDKETLPLIIKVGPVVQAVNILDVHEGLVASIADCGEAIDVVGDLAQWEQLYGKAVERLGFSPSYEIMELARLPESKRENPDSL